MILSDTDITARLEVGDLVISPRRPGAILPGSIDLHLGQQFLGYPQAERIIQVDPTDPDRPQMQPIPTEDGSVLLSPQFMGGSNSFLLGHTAETITLPIDLCGRIEGKSSLGRLGLAVHITAGFVDPGFRGQVVVELVNLSPVPIRLRVGMRIAQICLLRMSSSASAGYGHAKFGSHYQGQVGARAGSPVRHREPLGIGV